MEVKKVLKEAVSVIEFGKTNMLPPFSINRFSSCVKPDEMDFEVISKNYKLLAKKYHPDMPDGDHECFQRINAAHKLLKKELT